MHYKTAIKFAIIAAMIASAHNATGSIIGLGFYGMVVNDTLNLSSALILLFVLAVISHYLTDLIPHGHYSWRSGDHNDGSWRPNSESKKRINSRLVPFIILDSIGSLALYIIISAVFIDLGTWYFLAIGIFGAQLPDLLMLARKFNLVKNSRAINLEEDFHGGIIHWHDDKNGIMRPWSWTDIWQVAIVLAGFMAIILY